ncbi:MAG: hypothetical protein ABFD49_06310 [Armatimonadota bacterium]|nr:hypothetical protein [bacterium]
MALIKTDPSQTKTVIALLVALAAAVSVTVARVNHASAPPKAAAKAKTEESGRAEACVVTSLDRDPSRNPFAKPRSIGSTLKKTARVSRGTMSMSGEKIKVSPWRVDNVEIMRQDAAPAATPMASEEKSPPVFELMATVKGTHSYSAVMRTDGSQTRVVEVGDKMNGGFKVVKIEPDRAVLTDGKDTVSAVRPTGSGERKAESGEKNAL